MLFLLFFFFFQAEDGIRDLYVTGVQTCALPIFARADQRAGSQLQLYAHPAQSPDVARQGPAGFRSEERRVGKECRSRWARSAERDTGPCVVSRMDLAHEVGRDLVYIHVESRAIP